MTDNKIMLVNLYFESDPMPVDQWGILEIIRLNRRSVYHLKNNEHRDIMQRINKLCPAGLLSVRLARIHSKGHDRQCLEMTWNFLQYYEWNKESDHAK